MRVAILIALVLATALPARAQIATPHPEPPSPSDSGSGSDSDSAAAPPPNPLPEGGGAERASDSESESASESDTEGEPRPPLAPGVFYAGLALTFVSLAVGGYFGVEALAAHDRERTRDPRLPPDLAGIEESAITADVFFTLGALLAGATAIAAFFTDWQGGDAPAEPDAPSARVVPLPGGAAVVGRF